MTDKAPLGSDFEAWRRRHIKIVDDGLDRALRRQDLDRKGLGPLGQAMRYSLLGGGKRLRPLLALAAAEAVGGRARDALPLALAGEMIHAYSLVHDDLPALDDDDLRRGRPTCHKVFGEGPAILAGDALLTLAFAGLAGPDGPAAGRLGQAAAWLARGAGAAGMVGGQSLDLALEGRAGPASADEVRVMERLKTGALMAAALAGGGSLAGGGRADLGRLWRLGLDLGLAFQIRDDLLNLSGDPAITGKAVGSDAARGKVTLPALLGPAAAEKEMKTLGRKIMNAIGAVQARGRHLAAIIATLDQRQG
jgi:geranylgeranyl pyrophosphate synthase